jgi:hypothetical protein
MTDQITRKRLPSEVYGQIIDYSDGVPLFVGKPVPRLDIPDKCTGRFVPYADDLVILCRRDNAEAALHHLREIMGKLKLTVNVL